MTKRTKSNNGNGSTVFNAGTLVNILTIPILTGAVTFAGFYYTTRDNLARHDVEIATEIKARELAEKDQSEQRAKLSDSLLTYAQKTQEGISGLATHAAVQDEQIKNITGSLDRVISGLQNIETAVGRAAAAAPPAPRH